MLRKIITDYSKLGSPLAFSGPTRFRQAYSSKTISAEQLQDAFREIPTYARFKPRQKVLRNPSFVHDKRQRFEIDLVDVRHLSEHNRGTNYLLTCIDCFTKRAWVLPLKNKSGPSVVAAFKKILKQCKESPKYLNADRGKEIVNKSFYELCRKNNIILYHSDNAIHSPFIERFNRTFKSIMYKYLDFNHTKKYIDVLPKLLQTYLKRKHRSIRMSPNEAEKEENLFAVRQALSLTRVSKVVRQAPKFQVNDVVRISKQKQIFSRSFKRQYQEELFRVYKVHDTLPIPTYELSTLDGKEVIVGNFYAEELQKATEENLHEIEKVLKTRVVRGQDQSLVKWKHSDATSWIPSSDIVQK